MGYEELEGDKHTSSSKESIGGKMDRCSLKGNLEIS
jgi:hypothetical protein